MRLQNGLRLIPCFLLRDVNVEHAWSLGMAVATPRYWGAHVLPDEDDGYDGESLGYVERSWRRPHCSTITPLHLFP